MDFRKFVEKPGEGKRPFGGGKVIANIYENSVECREINEWAEMVYNKCTLSSKVLGNVAWTFNFITLRLYCCASAEVSIIFGRG